MGVGRPRPSPGRVLAARDFRERLGTSSRGGYAGQLNGESSPCHQERNRTEYEGIAAVDDTLLEELIEITGVLLATMQTP